ncbi:hypothetical protein, partial [Nocardia wallacei]|uniref:hypothetical protein n=1 Tax=Nocardia wallacei TaxID=480035 RepID=UPI002458D0D7
LCSLACRRMLDLRADRNLHHLGGHRTSVVQGLQVASGSVQRLRPIPAGARRHLRGTTVRCLYPR